MNRRLLALAVTLAAWTAGPAAAQDLGRFRDWNAHRFTEEGSRVCTMWSQPTKAQGKYTRRGEVFALVSHRPAEKQIGVVWFEMGYPFAADRELSVAIDAGKPVLLPVNGSIAEHDSPEVSRGLVRKMRAGARMVVTGRSQRGTETVDTYSLAGFTASYEAISKACRVR